MDPKPMYVIAVASQKGGVSKSTICIHLAAEAVRKRKRAAILEVDRQGTSSALWAARRLERLRPNDMVKDVDPNEAAPEVFRIDSLHLDQKLSELASKGYEVATIDLPGAHSPAVVKAISAADYLLIPTRPNDVDLQASIETADAARRLKKPYAFVFTFVPSTGSDTANMRDELEDAGLVVAPGGLGDRRKEFGLAIETGRTVQELNPDSKSAAEVRALWKWLEKQLEAAHGRKVA